MGWPGPMTHRQFRAWQAWLARQWDEPDRTDHYLMQVAAEVRRSAAGRKARQVKLEHLRIRFVEKKAPESLSPADLELRKKQVSQQRLARRLASLGNAGAVNKARAELDRRQAGG